MFDQTANLLQVPSDLVKSIVDFQYEHIKKESGKGSNVTIEFSEIGTLHWKTKVTNRYRRNLYYILGALHQNTEIPERDRKMLEIREKIKILDEKNAKYSKWDLAQSNRTERFCESEEDDL